MTLGVQGLAIDLAVTNRSNGCWHGRGATGTPRMFIRDIKRLASPLAIILTG